MTAIESQITNTPDGPAGPSRAPAWVPWTQAAVLAVLLVLAYWPEVYRVVDKWKTDGNWSHGWLVPFFSLYFLYMRRADLRGLRAWTNWPGLVALLGILCGYVFFLFVTPMGYPRSLSMVAAIAAIVLFLCGWRVLRITWFPIAFLLFAMPIPDTLYVELTLPLRQLASQVSAVLLKTCLGSDLQAATSGVVIDYVYAGKQGSLNVEEACSGMRLMMAFVTLGAAMAYLGDRPPWQRAVMVLACVPIAVFCNIIRVSTTGFLHVFGHEELAAGSAHELLGLAMLPIALGLFALLGYILDHLFVDEGPEPDGPADVGV